MCLGSNLLGHTSKPKSLESGVQTQLSWILCPDLTELDTSAGPNRFGPGGLIRQTWIMMQEPREIKGVKIRTFDL